MKGLPALPKLSKDQLKKVFLSVIGLIVLLYVYFNYFLGPLNSSRASMMQKIHDRENKLKASKSEKSKAAKLEQEVGKAAARYAALKALSPDSAPIAWFPPRIKTFFATQQIDKANARLESIGAFKEKELADWQKYNWIIDLPQADFDALGTAIAQLENKEPLLSITKIKIQTLNEQPQFQQVALTAATVIQKQ